MEFMYVGFDVYVWVYSFCMDSAWIFEVNISENQNCDGEWQDIQATSGKFLFFCIWGIDAGTYDGLLYELDLDGMRDS